MSLMASRKRRARRQKRNDDSLRNRSRVRAQGLRELGVRQGVAHHGHARRPVVHRRLRRGALLLRDDRKVRRHGPRLRDGDRPKSAGSRIREFRGQLRHAALALRVGRCVHGEGGGRRTARLPHRRLRRGRRVVRLRRVGRRPGRGKADPGHCELRVDDAALGAAVVAPAGLPRQPRLVAGRRLLRRRAAGVAVRQPDRTVGARPAARRRGARDGQARRLLRDAAARGPHGRRSQHQLLVHAERGRGRQHELSGGNGRGADGVARRRARGRGGALI